LSSSEAFAVLAGNTTSEMPSNESVMLGTLTAPSGPDSSGQTQFWIDHRLAWGFSVPNTCPIVMHGIDPDNPLGPTENPNEGSDSDATRLPSESNESSNASSGATSSDSPSACTATEWNFVDASSGEMLLGTWQLK
jgi:hypothetical protein